MDSSVFFQLSVAGWTQAHYQILIDFPHVHKQPSRCTQAVCINRQTNSRQITYHQPTAEDPHETCLQGETLTENLHI